MCILSWFLCASCSVLYSCFFRFVLGHCKERLENTFGNHGSPFIASVPSFFYIACPTVGESCINVLEVVCNDIWIECADFRFDAAIINT